MRKLRTGHRPRVGIVSETATAYMRGILRGIAAYAREQGPWDFSGQPRGVHASVGDIDAWDGDGLIVQAIDPGLVAQVVRKGLPAVNVSAVLPPQRPPLVSIDNWAVGRLVAEDLLARNYRTFAFVGYATHWYSRERRRGFGDALRQAGIEGGLPAFEDVEGQAAGSNGPPALSEWLATLPKPVGVMAANDVRALQVAEAAAAAGVAIPAELALVGVDDDELVCEFASPPLSSVRVGSERIGMEAARLLDRMMRGAKPPTQPVLLQPLGVATRRSSDIVAVSDTAVSRALTFIRDNAASGIQVGDVARHAGVSRRSLEVRFRRAIGRTPWEEIRAEKIRRLKRMLAETDMTMDEIADAVGLLDARQVSIVFRKETGETPTGFRRRVRRLPSRGRTR